jgi:hypothetical protein
MGRPIRPVNNCADSPAGLQRVRRELGAHEGNRICRNSLLSFHLFLTPIRHLIPDFSFFKLHRKFLKIHRTFTSSLHYLHRNSRSCALSLNPPQKKQPFMIFERRPCLSTTLFQVVSANEPAVAVVAITSNRLIPRLHCDSSPKTHFHSQSQNQT